MATTTLTAKPKAPASQFVLTAAGNQLQAKYSAQLAELKAEITKALPSVSESKKSALQQATDAAKKAKDEADVANKNLGSIGGGKALIEHAKGKWIGGAEKGIASAKAALAKATTPAERAAAEKDLANWQANKEDGLKALAERQAAYDKAKLDEPKFRKAVEEAQAALAKAQADEVAAVQSMLADLAPVLSGGKLDGKLAKAVILTHATPQGLAEFAQQGATQAALVDQLLADDKMMLEMLANGGAAFGKYGQAMEIYTAIQKASPNARSGNLQRLAMGTSLEHAKPIGQTNPADKPGAEFIDPVKRYQHYEKAFLAGELDSAFKNLTAWEYRHVVNSEAPDEILAWGREMLRTYRPDHISAPDYGWRYVSSVKTEVPYGSQNVKNDLPSLHQYQNIIMNGGVCGRRAFFGRFILRSFGIPTWGVTQKAHAALSHWTPKGWVVNLGAGFGSSWWDKDEVSLSGTQFLMETQARAHGPEEYLKIQRAQWVGRVLGEPAYNDRKKVAGGFWSSIAHLQERMLASKADTLGPLGQELAEANEAEQKVKSDAVSASDQQATTKDGVINIPAVAHTKVSGKSAAMKSYAGGMQLHCLGGFKAQYPVEAPKAGKYLLTARVATVQTGQKFLVSTGAGKPVEIAVPYTCGMWQHTPPVEITLTEGTNAVDLELVTGSRGVTVKDISIKAAK